MARNILIDLIIIIGMLSALILLIYIAITAKSEGNKCYADPLAYAAKKLTEANGAEFIGSGYFLKENSPIIKFDQYNVSIQFPSSPQNIDNEIFTNWSGIIKTTNN